RKGSLCHPRPFIRHRTYGKSARRTAALRNIPATRRPPMTLLPFLTGYEGANILDATSPVASSQISGLASVLKASPDGGSRLGYPDRACRRAALLIHAPARTFTRFSITRKRFHMGSKLKMCFHALLAAGFLAATPVWAQNGTIT